MMRKPSHLHETARKGGFTLLEVAIALVIFVIGALAIVRIFPGALGVVQNSGDQTVAVNLNRGLLARIQTDSLEAPFGIHEPSATVDAYGINGPTRINKSLPNTNTQDFDSSALAHFKLIDGEKQKVVSNAVFTNFPYTGTPTVYTEHLIEGVLIKADGTFDTTNATPALSAGDKYYVDYHYLNSGGFLSGVEYEPLNDLAGTVIQATGTNIVPGSIKVIARTEITPTAPAANEPEIGKIVLPATPPVSDGDVVSVDYEVSDWRNLVQDTTTQIDPETSKPAARVPMQLAQGGDIYAAFSGTGSAPFTVDRDHERSGSIYDASFPATEQPVRLVFRTLDEWTQQVSVATKSYLPFKSTYSLANYWRCYSWDSADATSLYFKPAEVGKTVQVTYQDTSGAEHTEIVTIADRWINLPAAVNNNMATQGLVSIAQLNYSARSILSVRGLSLQSRTAWLNGDRYTQSIATSYRSGGVD